MQSLHFPYLYVLERHKISVILQKYSSLFSFSESREVFEFTACNKFPPLRCAPFVFHSQLAVQPVLYSGAVYYNYGPVPLVWSVVPSIPGRNEVI